MPNASELRRAGDQLNRRANYRHGKCDDSDRLSR